MTTDLTDGRRDYLRWSIAAHYAVPLDVVQGDTEAAMRASAHEALTAHRAARTA